jgi:hypothetical protein
VRLLTSQHFFATRHAVWDDHLPRDTQDSEDLIAILSDLRAALHEQDTLAKGLIAERTRMLNPEAITSVTPRNATSGPLPIPRLRRTLSADKGMTQMRSCRQGEIAQGGDWFSWLLPTLLCLILIACLISLGLSTISHAVHALQDAPTALASDPIPVSSANSSDLCFSSLPGRAMWHSFLPSGHEKTSNVEAVLAMVQVS